MDKKVPGKCPLFPAGAPRTDTPVLPQGRGTGRALPGTGTGSTGTGAVKHEARRSIAGYRVLIAVPVSSYQISALVYGARYPSHLALSPH